MPILQQLFEFRRETMAKPRGTCDKFYSLMSALHGYIFFYKIQLILISFNIMAMNTANVLYVHIGKVSCNCQYNMIYVRYIYILPGQTCPVLELAEMCITHYRRKWSMDQTRSVIQTKQRQRLGLTLNYSYSFESNNNGYQTCTNIPFSHLSCTRKWEIPLVSNIFLLVLHYSLSIIFYKSQDE